MDQLVPGSRGRLAVRVFVFLLYMMLLLLAASACNKKPDQVMESPVLVLRPQHLEVHSPKDIQLLTDSLVAPILYSNITGLDSLPLHEKKMRFISALLPAILVAKEKLANEKKAFGALISRKDWDQEDSLFFQKLSVTYKTSDTTLILSALETHPNSIVLAQAAIESGWGNSRIFGEANNLFGIWSYSSNEPRIAASIKRDGKTIYLRKYADISESISDYFVTIGRSRPYRRFREARLKTKRVEELIPHLIYYSERREAYTDQLGTMIRFNNLTRFDHYKLDSSFYVTEVFVE